jgi:hypothetical protein
MMHELWYTDTDGSRYSFTYDDEDGGNGIVTVGGTATLPFSVLMGLIHTYQLDARYDHFEHRPVNDSQDTGD